MDGLEWSAWNSWIACRHGRTDGGAKYAKCICNMHITLEWRRVKGRRAARQEPADRRRGLYSRSRGVRGVNHLVAPSRSRLRYFEESARGIGALRIECDA